MSLDDPQVQNRLTRSLYLTESLEMLLGKVFPSEILVNEVRN